MESVTSRIKQYASELGFSMLGVISADPSPRVGAYIEWLATGMHGEMAYMAREDRIARRQDLNVILPNAKSMIIAGLDYFTLKLPDEISTDPARGRISNYAWAADYHDVMLPRLESLANYVRTEMGLDTATRAYVDTGAVLERSHAERAGLGFTGKNTMLINPRRGSFFFIGEIITDALLDFDDTMRPVVTTGCGTCTRCLTACPTNAFPRPYVLDARRCISYLTIELKGSIPRHLRPLMGNWIYGCDVCQDVCPWQRFASPQWESVFAPINLDRAAPLLSTVLELNDDRFAVLFKGSPIKRITRDRLVRNACVAAGNSNQIEFSEYLVPLLDDHSALVRGHAAWALGQLRRAHRELKAALHRETNEETREEISEALSAAIKPENPIGNTGRKQTP
jgi:epoxyqueuosine reductase